MLYHRMPPDPARSTSQEADMASNCKAENNCLYDSNRCGAAEAGR